MLPTYLHNFFRNLIYVGILLAAISFVPVFAKEGPPPPSVSVPTAESMVANIANQVPAVMKFTTALAYVLGFYFVFFGLLKLKQYGEARTQMSSDHSIKGPLIYLGIGAALIYLPTTVEVGLTTFWTNPNPYGYVTQTDQWGQLYKTVFLIIEVLGVIAFIRGLVILSGLGGQAQQGTLGRGLTHVIGGIFCINLYQFVQVVMSTLGIQT